MIRLKNDKTVGGIRYGKGTMIDFTPPIESELISTGDAEVYPLVSRPVETLTGSAVATSCAFSGVDEVLASFNIPAGILGVNSVLQIEPVWTFTSSANNKTLRIKIGTTMVYSALRTTSVKEAPLFVLANRNSLARQIKPYDGVYVTAGPIAPETYAINFSVPVTVEITGQRANSGDSLTLEYYRVLHFVGD